MFTKDHVKDAARIEARMRSRSALPADASPVEVEANLFAMVRGKLLAADKGNDHESAHALADLHGQIAGSSYGAPM